MITVKNLTHLQAATLGFKPHRRMILLEFDEFLRQIVKIEVEHDTVGKDHHSAVIRDGDGRGSMILELDQALPPEILPILDEVAKFMREGGMPHHLKDTEWILFGAVRENTVPDADTWGYGLYFDPSNVGLNVPVAVTGYSSPGIAKLAGLVKALKDWRSKPTEIEVATRKWISQFSGNMGVIRRSEVAELPISFAPLLDQIKSALDEKGSWVTMDLKGALADAWKLTGIEEDPRGEIGLTLARKDDNGIVRDRFDTGRFENFDSALFFGALIAVAKDMDAGWRDW